MKCVSRILKKQNDLAVLCRLHKTELAWPLRFGMHGLWTVNNDSYQQTTNNRDDVSSIVAQFQLLRLELLFCSETL